MHIIELSHLSVVTIIKHALITHTKKTHRR